MNEWFLVEIELYYSIPKKVSTPLSVSFNFIEFELSIK